MVGRPNIGQVAWIAVASCLVLLLLLTGDWIRGVVRQELRFALCATGATLLGGSTLMYIFLPLLAPAMRSSSWAKLWGSAAFVGFLMFVLFVQDMECELQSTSRGGISAVCR
jgi:hypothetical protein